MVGLAPRGSSTWASLVLILTWITQMSEALNILALTPAVRTTIAVVFDFYVDLSNNVSSIERRLKCYINHTVTRREFKSKPIKTLFDKWHKIYALQLISAKDSRGWNL